MDLLRPEVSFQEVMRRRIDKRLLPSSSHTPQQPQDKVRANDALATPVPSQPFDEKGELEQVNVLYSLLENRYSKKVPAGAQSIAIHLHINSRCEFVLNFSPSLSRLHIVSSLRLYIEARLEPHLLRRSAQRVSRSTATIVVSEGHQPVEWFPALFLKPAVERKISVV